MSKLPTMDRNLALEAVRVTEAAALASSKMTGRGDSKGADQAAVDAMRQALNGLGIRGRVVIGEGERDEAPMLYIGEEVGDGSGPHVDIALDPLEGTDICATGAPNALAVMAFADEGGFLNAPDVYMDKIAIGPGYPDGLLDITAPLGENLQRLADAKGVAVADLVICILKRERNDHLEQAARDAGAKVYLIGDGDVAAVIAAALPGADVDMYVSNGGAPEGVLAAAALTCIGGAMQARLTFRNEDERARARKWGIEDLDRVYETSDLAHGNVMFAATGVTDGSLLRGVKVSGSQATTQSIVMRSTSGTVRYVDATHNLDVKDRFGLKPKG